MSELDQHINWIRGFLETMTADNWADNKLRIERQIDSVVEQIAILHAKAAKHDECSAKVDCLSRDGTEQPDWNYTSQPGRLGGPSTKD